MKQKTILKFVFGFCMIFTSINQAFCQWLGSSINTTTTSDVGIGILTPDASADIATLSYQDDTHFYNRQSLHIVNDYSVPGATPTSYNDVVSVWGRKWIIPAGGPVISVVNPTPYFAINAKGYVGIGLDPSITSNYKFDVDGNIHTSSNATVSGNLTVNDYVQIGTSITTPGSATPDYKLYVQTGILTEKLKVADHSGTDWADFVFNKDYNLMSLKDVEKFIKNNNHLPNVPSAQEIANNGIDVAKMDATLLQKIEELTLYVIELQKQNQLLSKKIEKLGK